jgi:hypothetical protein
MALPNNRRIIDMAAHASREASRELPRQWCPLIIPNSAQEAHHWRARTERALVRETEQQMCNKMAKALRAACLATRG